MVAALALLLGALGGVTIGQVQKSAPDELGADVGFARDMQTHHQQAVEMALLVRDRTDDEAVRTLAYDIVTTQQHQAGQMYGWLALWGLPQSSRYPPMAWMGDQGSADATPDTHTMTTGNEPLPGMASRDQLDELRGATGLNAERMFLQLMVAHHRGGVAMAEAAQELARTEVVRNLASAISVSQAQEVIVLDDMLTARQGSVSGQR